MVQKGAAGLRDQDESTAGRFEMEEDIRNLGEGSKSNMSGQALAEACSF